MGLCDGTQDEWTCLEPDAALAAVTEKKIRMQQLPGCCRSINGYISDLNSNAQFDSILYVDVLEHIRDDKGELNLAVSHLAESGHLIVIAPAHPFLWSPFDEGVGHFRRYTRAQMASSAPCHLTLIRMCYLDSIGLLASLANRLVLRQIVPSAAQIKFWDKFMVPLSRVLDFLICNSFGKSLLGIWQLKKPERLSDYAESAKRLTSERGKQCFKIVCMK